MEGAEVEGAALAVAALEAAEVGRAALAPACEPGNVALAGSCDNDIDLIQRDFLFAYYAKTAISRACFYGIHFLSI